MRMTKKSSKQHHEPKEFFLKEKYPTTNRINVAIFPHAMFRKYKVGIYNKNMFYILIPLSIHIS